MEQQNSVRFESVIVRDEWGRFDADGLHLYEDPRAADVSEFFVCVIGSEQIAVFVNPQLPDSARARLATHRPDWLHAIVFAQVASCPDAALVILDAEIVVPDDAALAMCAFAATCVAFNAGAINIVPQRYQVRFARRGSWELTERHQEDRGVPRPS